MKEGYRALDEDEKRHTERAAKRLIKQVSYDEYLLLDAELKLSHGLEQNYLRQKKIYEDKANILKKEISINKANIALLSSHLEEGVKIKEGDK